MRGRLSPGLAAPPTLTGFLLIDSLLAGRLDAFGDALRHLVLPAFTLSLGGLATIMRFTRAGVLDTLQKDFVTYERAQGFPPRALIWMFVLRNSVVAAITQIGLLFGGTIAGAVVVETIFDWPGIGFYTVQAILTADYKVMLAVTLLIGVDLCAGQHPGRRRARPARPAAAGAGLSPCWFSPSSPRTCRPCSAPPSCCSSLIVALLGAAAGALSRPTCRPRTCCSA